MEADAPFVFDPFDEATRRNPFPLYVRARREHPVWAPEGAPVVSIFRYEDIQSVLRDPATWSNAFAPPPGFEPEDLPPSMLVTDPSAHCHRLSARTSGALPASRGTARSRA